MTKYLITDIDYDIDVEEGVELPTELVVELTDEELELAEVEELLSDKISDETGFCHRSFSFNELK